MRLRRGIGFALLALLLYYLVADPRFCAEFFNLSTGAAVPIVTVLSACILPNKFAWPFMALIACYLAHDLLFVPDNSVAPGVDLIPEIVLVAVFFALAYLTFRSGRSIRKAIPPQA